MASRHEEFEKLREMAKRILEAFESPLHAFIYQRSIDDVNLVATVIREAGIGPLVNQVVLSGREGIYALLVNDRGCKNECAYGRCDPSDRECLDKCVEECKSKRLEAVVTRLREYIGGHVNR